MKKFLLLSVMLGGVCMNAAAMIQDNFVPANPAEAQDEDVTPVVENEEESSVLSSESETEETDSMDEEHLSIKLQSEIETLTKYYQKQEKEDLKRIGELESKVSALEFELEAKAQNYNSLVLQNKQLDDQLKNLTEENRRLSLQTDQQLRDENAQLRKEKNRLEGNNRRLERILRRNTSFSPLSVQMTGFISSCFVGYVVAVMDRFIESSSTGRECSNLVWGYAWSAVEKVGTMFSSVYGKLSQYIRAWW